MFDERHNSRGVVKLFGDLSSLKTASSPESEFRAAGLVRQSTGKEVAKRLPHVVVKWSPNFVLQRVQKRGWWKRCYRTATVFGGQKKEQTKRAHNPPFCSKSLSHSVAADHCRVTTCLEACVGDLFFDHFATT